MGHDLQEVVQGHLLPGEPNDLLVHQTGEAFFALYELQPDSPLHGWDAQLLDDGMYMQHHQQLMLLGNYDRGQWCGLSLLRKPCSAWGAPSAVLKCASLG